MPFDIVFFAAVVVTFQIFLPRSTPKGGSFRLHLRNVFFSFRFFPLSFCRCSHIILRYDSATNSRLQSSFNAYGFVCSSRTLRYYINNKIICHVCKFVRRARGKWESKFLLHEEEKKIKSLQTFCKSHIIIKHLCRKNIFIWFIVVKLVQIVMDSHKFTDIKMSVKRHNNISPHFWPCFRRKLL